MILSCLLAAFVTIQQTDTNGWTLVDAVGEPFRMRGVDHVRYEGHWCGKLKTFPYRDWNDRHYPSRAAWEQETLGRLKGWGFNALTGKPDESLLHRGLAHTHTLDFGKRLCGKKRPPEDWIVQGRTPCHFFPNVFSTNFVRECEAWAERECAPRRNDGDLIGYFLDNELAWWGTAGVNRRGSAEAMYETALSLPEGHSARRAAEAFAGTKAEFLALVAERYFAVTCAAVRKADPNHLILGARFAGFGGAADPVWAAAGRHCDVVSFNLYPWIDLAANKLWVWNTDRRELGETFDRYQALARRPFLITEWSFIGLDAGLPCTKGMGQRFATQTERARAIRALCRFFDAKPYVIGDDYFMWVDEPKLGIGKEFGEDSNYGLVSDKNVPWAEVTEVFRDRWLIVNSPEAPWNALDDGALREKAKLAIARKLSPVTEKKLLPASGNPHDYFSMGPYWWPNPSTTNSLPYIRKDGQHNPESSGDRNRLGVLVDDVTVLAAAALRFQDRVAGRAAAEKLKTFFLDPATRMNPNLDFAQAIPGICTGRGIGIIDTLLLARFGVDAIVILRETGNLSAEECRGLNRWFSDFLAWLESSKNGREEFLAKNNHGTNFDLQCAVYSLFLGRLDPAREILRGVPARRIDRQIEPDGRQPLELARTKSMSYSIYNLKMFCDLARLGEKVGVDLWRYESGDGRSIRRAIDFLKPYWAEEVPWPYPTITPFDRNVGNGLMAYWHHFESTQKGR